MSIFIRKLIYSMNILVLFFSMAAPLINSNFQNRTSFQFTDLKVLSKFEVPITTALPPDAPPGTMVALQRADDLDRYDIFFYNGEVWSIIDASTSEETLTPSTFAGSMSSVLPVTIIDGVNTDDVQQAFIQWDMRSTGAGASSCTTVRYTSNGDVAAGFVASGAGTSVFFNSDGTTFFTAAPAGGTILILTKYDQLGFGVWNALLQGAGMVPVSGPLTVDTSDNIIYTGTFRSNPIEFFDSNGVTSGITLANTGANNCPFIVKYSGAGFVQWATRISSSAATNSIGAVSVNASGNIVMCGSFQGTLTFFNSDTTAFGTTLTSAGNTDGFIVEYNSTGFVQFVIQIGSTGVDPARGCKILTDGSIVVSGSYTSVPVNVFNANGSLFTTLPYTSVSNASYLVKYDNAGSGVWSSYANATTSIAYGQLDVDGAGNIIVGSNGGGAGSIATIVSSDASTITTLASSSSTNGFIIKYNSAGVAQWSAKIGGTSTDSFVNLSTEGTNNMIAIVGSYQSNPMTLFDSDGTAAITLTNSTGTQDIYVCKYNTDGEALWAAKSFSSATDSSNSVHIVGNGNIVAGGLYGNATLTVQDSLGTTFNTLASGGGTNSGVMTQYLQANVQLTLANPTIDGFMKTITTTDIEYAWINPAATVFDKNAVAYDKIRLANKQSITLIWDQDNTAWNVVSANM